MCQQRTPLGRHEVPLDGIEAFREASATSAAAPVPRSSARSRDPSSDLDAFEYEQTVEASATEIPLPIQNNFDGTVGKEGGGSSC